MPVVEFRLAFGHDRQVVHFRRRRRRRAAVARVRGPRFVIVTLIRMLGLNAIHSHRERVGAATVTTNTITTAITTSIIVAIAAGHRVGGRGIAQRVYGRGGRRVLVVLDDDAVGPAAAGAVMRRGGGGGGGGCGGRVRDAGVEGGRDQRADGQKGRLLDAAAAAAARRYRMLLLPALAGRRRQAAVADARRRGAGAEAGGGRVLLVPRVLADDRGGGRATQRVRRRRRAYARRVVVGQGRRRGRAFAVVALHQPLLEVLRFGIEACALGQPFDLQRLSRFQKGAQLLLRDVHLAAVHVVEHRFQLLEFNIFQYEDRVLFVVRAQ